MEALQNLPPIVALVLGLVLLAWLVLVFLVPFMIESIRQSARKSHEELVEMNAKLDRLNAALARGSVRADPYEAREPYVAAPTAPGRREPTISETEVRQRQRQDRREPIVR